VKDAKQEISGALLFRERERRIREEKIETGKHP